MKSTSVPAAVAAELLGAVEHQVFWSLSATAFARSRPELGLRGEALQVRTHWPVGDPAPHPSQAASRPSGEGELWSSLPQARKGT